MGVLWDMSPQNVILELRKLKSNLAPLALKMSAPLRMLSVKKSLMKKGAQPLLTNTAAMLLSNVRPMLNPRLNHGATDIMEPPMLSLSLKYKPKPSKLPALNIPPNTALMSPSPLRRLPLLKLAMLSPRLTANPVSTLSQRLPTKPDPLTLPLMLANKFQIVFFIAIQIKKKNS